MGSKCNYCEMGADEAVDYLPRVGVMKSRVYVLGDRLCVGIGKERQMYKIIYCPMCGRKLKEDR